MRRNQVICTMLLILCVAAFGFSQVQIGLIGGVNMANVTFDPEEDDVAWKSKTVLGMGAVVEKAINAQISLQFEPMYLEKGSTADVEAIDGASIDFNLTYIEIPVMVKYSFPGKSTIPYVMTGPTIGINLSAEQVAGGFPNLPGIPYENGTTDIKDDLKSLDFGIGFGAGVCMPYGDRTLFIQARYVMGLSNILDTDDDTTVKTKGIQILGGIKIPLNM